MNVASIDPRMGSVIVAEELENLKQRIIANMVAAKAVATGNTIRSLHVVPRPFGATLESQQRMPFGVLETGRKGGNVPKPVINGVPVGLARIIYDWMMAKGIHGTPLPYKTSRPHKYTEQERGDRSLSFAIATTIMNKGTRLYREGGRDTIYTKEIPVTIERVQKRLGRLVQAFVVEQIQPTIPTR